MKRDFVWKGEICKIGNKTTNANKKNKEKEMMIISLFDFEGLT